MADRDVKTTSCSEVTVLGTGYVTCIASHTGGVFSGHQGACGGTDPQKIPDQSQSWCFICVKMFPGILCVCMSECVYVVLTETLPLGPSLQTPIITPLQRRWAQTETTWEGYSSLVHVYSIAGL